jgi:hypothetical protein
MAVPGGDSGRGPSWPSSGWGSRCSLSGTGDPAVGRTEVVAAPMPSTLQAALRIPS